METPVKSSRPQLFTVQLWLEELGDGQAEWRGKVQNVESGEEHYFRQWTAVGRLLRAMVPKMNTDSRSTQSSKNINSKLI